MGGESLQAALDFLGSWLDYRSREVDIPGFCVAIYYKDTVIFSQAYGLANLERRQPMIPQHVFSLASQSKMFTATSVLQLMERGQLQLLDRVVQHIPWLAEHPDKRFQEITINQLLSHSAGLVRDGLDSDFWELARPFPSPAQLQATIMDARIVLEPNTQLKYSNLGYALLGQIIETLSGQTYRQFVNENIIAPLRLSHTLADYRSSLANRMATAYGPLHKQKRTPLEPRLPTASLAAAVGVHATAEDMCYFAAAHFFGNETLLGNDTRKEAQRNQWSTLTGPNRGAEFGLGFEVQTIGRRRVLGHSGHMAGHVSATYFDPYDRLAISVTVNCKDAPIVRMTRGVFETLDWFAIHTAEKPPQNLTRFGGRMHSTIVTMEVVPASSSLAAIDPDNWEPFTHYETLEPINNTTLRVTTPGSVYNQGELVEYTFSDDAIQTIRYAGVTMLPEPHYQLLTYTDPTEQRGHERLFTAEDLRRAQLQLGRVTDVRRTASSEPGSYQLTVDFGPIAGTTRTYLRALPEQVAPQALRGRMILGAHYSSWRFGDMIETIVPLGIANADTDALLPTTWLYTVPDPSFPKTLPPSSAVELLDSYEAETFHALFKFEALPEYPPEDEWTESFTAWLQGKQRKSIALMDRAQAQPPPWFTKHIRYRKRNIRIRVSDLEPTPHQRWELELFRRLHIPLAHDHIYLLPRKYLAGVNAPEGDMTILDDARVMVNNYQGYYVSHSTFYDKTEGHEIGDFLKLERQLFQLAQTYGTKLTL